MRLVEWDELPFNMRNEEVKKYYDILSHKKCSLVLKRIFDIVVSFIMIVILSPVFIILSIAIKLDSPGPFFFRQVRVTQYGKEFRIFKFRTMVNDAEKSGTQVTVENDSRITRVGKVIRKCRLDEIPQLLNILIGDMTFVGTRPEVPKYVARYDDEMLATLLLPAGVTSEASIFYKDEDKLLAYVDDTDEVYISDILPDKMSCNLKGLLQFSLLKDIKLMFMTLFAVCGKEYSRERNINKSVN